MRLPLFPLHAVVFPHLPLPLHVFEERYRALVRDVMADASPYAGRFLVSMITEGAEVGDGPIPPQVRPVASIVEVHTAERFPDGRWAVLVVGAGRATIKAVDRAGPYALANVARLPERIGNEEAARALLSDVQEALDRYVRTVKQFVTTNASIGSDSPEVTQVAASLDEVLKPISLPDDPLAASYAVGGVLQIELLRKQQLLELPDAVSRLRAELGLLRREARLLANGAMPPVGPGDLRYHPN